MGVLLYTSIRIPFLNEKTAARYCCKYLSKCYMEELNKDPRLNTDITSIIGRISPVEVLQLLFLHTEQVTMALQ